MKKERSVCVYAGAHSGANPAYLEAAEALGSLLAQENIAVVYGGGVSGLMGALANAALTAGGQVHGIRPLDGVGFEPEHTSLTSMVYTDDLGSRKRLMWARANAIVVLPGGTGTADELLEAITQKRLGLHQLPIVILNIDRFFDRLLNFIQYAAQEGFVGASQFSLWHTVDNVRAVIPLVARIQPPGQTADP